MGDEPRARRGGGWEATAGLSKRGSKAISQRDGGWQGPSTHV